MFDGLAIREEGDEESNPVANAGTHEDPSRDEETPGRENDSVEVYDGAFAGDGGE